MAFSSIILAVVLATLSFTESSIIVESKKLAIITEEVLETANAVRNITISTPQDKVQLASMAMDFVDAFSYAIYTMNNAIPNLVGTQSFDQVALTSEVLSDMVYDIEQAIPKDAEKLKEVLVETLEVGHKLAIAFKNVTPNHEFELNQLKRKHDYILFGIYNLKLQALLFNKTNKELEPEIVTSVTQFVQALKALPISNENNKALEQELRHALLHLSVVTYKISFKLQNWVEANPDKTQDIRIVEDVAELMSDLYAKCISAASVYSKPSYMRNQLISLYGDGAKPVGNLLDIKYSDKTGGQEFIRSAIFHGLTIGRAYAANINTVLKNI